MAEEIKQIISIDTNEAITNLKDYRKHIEDLKGKLLGLEKGTEEYNKIANEVASQQTKLNEVMTDSKYGIDANTKSYNALAAQMAQLKKEWKNMEIGSDEWKKAAEQINELNDQLKEADASTGNFQRNVGNYASSFMDAFTKMGESAKGLNNPLKIASTGIKTFGASLKALAMNPIGAVIMAIVVAVKALKKGFEGSEQATNSLKKAFSALQPILDAVTNLFTGFAKIVGNIAEKVIPALVNGFQKAELAIAKLLNKIGIVSDERLKSIEESINAQKAAVAVTQDLADREIALTEKKRKAKKEEAKLEYEISELRAKAAQKDKYTAAEREKFLTDAIAKEREINKTKVEIAEEELAILQEKAKLTDNNAEMNEALAEAEAHVWEVRKEVNDKEREYNSQLAEIRGKKVESSNKAVKVEEDNVEREAILSKEAYESKKNEIENKIALIDTYLAVVEEGSKEEVRLLEEKESQQYQLSVETAKYRIKDAEVLNQTLENLEIAHYNRLEKINDDALQKSIAKRNAINSNKVKETEMQYGSDSMEAIEARIDYYQKYYDSLSKAFGETEEDFKRRQLDALKQLNDEIEKQSLKKIEIQTQVNDNNVADIERSYGSNSMKAYDARIEAYKAYADSLIQLQDETDEEFEARHNAALDRVKEEERAKLEQRISNYTNLATGIGNIMGSIADIYEQDIQNRLKRGEISEQEAEKEYETSKKIQIAQATISMLAGITAAISGLFTTKTGPWDIALAAVQAATIAAAGIANIQKIKSTQLNSSTSTSVASTPTSVAATPRVSDYTPTYTAAVTGLNEQETLNNNMANTLSQTPIYVSVTDINDVQNKVKVREEESRF